jgi:hypothetical protein
MAGLQYENEELKLKIAESEKMKIRATQMIKEKVNSRIFTVLAFINYNQSDVFS